MISEAYLDTLHQIPSLMSQRIPYLNQNCTPLSFMVWNVQGAGSRAFIAALKEIIKVNKPVVVALVETHMGSDQAMMISKHIGFSGHLRVDAQGYAGGIWVYWRQEVVNVREIDNSMQHINMEISRLGEEPWYFTAIYASPISIKKHELWNFLRSFAASNNHPWMLGGDFNDTRYTWERNTCCDEVNRRSKHFDEWIDSMELLEVEFSGPSHTWARGLSEDTRKSARLDRVLCNSEWATRFSQASVRHLPAIQSDHYPLLISPNGFSPLEAINKPFHFQAAWLTHEKFQEFMESNWSNEAPLVPFLHSLSQKLQTWNKEVFHNIFKKKRELIAHNGGLGLTSMRQSNAAFLTKLDWSLITEPKSLWSRVVRFKYCHGRCDLDMFRATSNCSNLWKGIVENAKFIRKGAQTAIGNGNWATNQPLSNQCIKEVPEEILGATVEEMWDPNSGWKWEVFAEYLPLSILKQI
ncbi:hypothetical protein RDABS01_018138 [Bienertia sinuspersici]